MKKLKIYVWMFVLIAFATIAGNPEAKATIIYGLVDTPAAQQGYYSIDSVTGSTTLLNPLTGYQLDISTKGSVDRLNHRVTFMANQGGTVDPFGYISGGSNYWLSLDLTTGAFISAIGAPLYPSQLLMLSYSNNPINHQLITLYLTGLAGIQAGIVDPLTLGFVPVGSLPSPGGNIFEAPIMNINFELFAVTQTAQTQYDLERLADPSLGFVSYLTIPYLAGAIAIKNLEAEPNSGVPIAVVYNQNAGNFTLWAHYPGFTPVQLATLPSGSWPGTPEQRAVGSNFEVYLGASQPGLSFLTTANMLSGQVSQVQLATTARILTLFAN